MGEDISGSFERKGIHEGVETHDLNEGEISELLFYSFFYSQGSPAMQNDVFAYIAEEHPEWKVPDSVRGPAYQRSSERIRAMVERGTHGRQPEEKIAKETKLRFDSLCTALNEGFVLADKVDRTGQERLAKVPLSEYSLEDLLQGMVDRDRKFLTIQQGRPNRPENVATPHLRADLSHFVEYVLKQKPPPGPPVFRQLMVDLKGIVDHLDEHFGPTANGARSQIRGFLEQFNETHPRDEVDLSAF